MKDDARNAGFTLIELMIVVAIISVLAAASVPSLLSSRMAANESNAIATLRNLCSAQAQFQTMGAIDDDRDGTGEYGWFAEMAGAVNLNGRTAGVGLASPLDPPILASKFGSIDPTGRLNFSGYLYQLHLPGAGGAGLSEAAGGGPTAAEDADYCEIYWSCYAYPVSNGTTGTRAFFVDHRGEITQTKMSATIYDATQPAPVFNAALTVVAGDMSDTPALGVPASDGNSWAPVQ